MSLFAELKRRNVLRVAAAYVAVAWLVIQVVETIFPAFGFGDAAIRGVVTFLAIGFFPAVISAWAFELTPEGLVRDSEVDRSSPTIRAMGKRLDRLMIVALALALGYFAFDKFMLDPARDRAIADAAKEEGRAEAERESDARASDGPPMVAVLPFVAVGGGERSTFFAAGVHDDLLTQLAQQPSMRVISRTSVLEYEGTKKNIREIGAELGADAILEGGVQTAGDRIRINAQLIDARTDEHLWADTFDRELTAANIFEAQAEIARSIATALTGTMGAQSATTDRLPTTNMAAYRAYHEALALSHVQMDLTSEEYRDLLRKAGKLDPTYTRPWAELVGSLTLSAFSGADPEEIAEAEQALAHIQSVAPGSADALIAQAYYTYYIIKDYEFAHEIAMQAQALMPSDPRLAAMKSWIERRLGDYDARIESLRLARTLDPRNPWWTNTLVWNLKIAHRYDEAWEEIQAIDDPNYRIAWVGAWLRVREHRDLGELAAEMDALHEEYGEHSHVEDRLETRLVNREFEVAEALLAEMPVSEDRRYWAHIVVPDNTLYELQLRWFLGQEEQLAALVADTRARLAEYVPDGSVGDGRTLLLAALLAALEGDTEETERLIRRWNREEAQDWPERVHSRDRSCQILGLAGAAEAAVECIRTGLEEPSHVAPYLEPWLPHYDRIREDPAFVALLDELDGAPNGQPDQAEQPE
jgi:TolB-like protein